MGLDAPGSLSVKRWLWSRPIDLSKKKGGSFPRVTVVTPSYNQAEFLEETIRSILLQEYPNLEYIIIDGGSDDGTVEVIRKYERWLAYWVSEADQGQADAINKGWRRATGDYVTWLNSDDLLAPGSLLSTADALAMNKSLDIVYGDVLLIDENSELIPRPYNIINANRFDLKSMAISWRNPVPQQGFLMRRSLLDRIGYLDDRLQFVMDFEYWTRIAMSGGKGKALHRVVGLFRHHQKSKSSNIQLRRIEERYKIYERIFGQDISAPLIGKEAVSKANLDRHATYLAYTVPDAGKLRQYARQYLCSAGIQALPFVTLMGLLSATGDLGMAIFRSLHRSATRSIYRLSRKDPGSRLIDQSSS
jgi:glycosyltransferase involved in cell wall biosynthesis